MRKTAEEIEEDIYKLLAESDLASEISGGIYRDGMRPFNSQDEDAVIYFLTGLDGQKQMGIVNVNIYIPNIDNGNRLLVKNTTRCKRIGQCLSDFKESLMGSRLNTTRSGYWFIPNGTMIRSFEEKEINQHYVNLRLEFEFLTI